MILIFRLIIFFITKGLLLFLKFCSFIFAFESVHPHNLVVNPINSSTYRLFILSIPMHIVRLVLRDLTIKSDHLFILLGFLVHQISFQCFIVVSVDFTFQHRLLKLYF